jgi:rfaE bifunctional protein nucleotidyltransferase chain/domain
MASGRFHDFLDSLPHILAGETLRQVLKALRDARRKGRAVVWAQGAHVVKCGLSPIVISLMEHGIITTLALNGAVAIHDVEMALFGQTSEEVDQALPEGTFGMAKETADFLNEAALRAQADQLGFGEALGVALTEAQAPFAELSLLAAAHRLGLPATVHVAIGTDIVHMHPSAQGAAIGDASHRDFRILTEAMSGLSNGGVLMNVGSAVVLPEVLLKAMAILANLGRLRDFTGVNLDFLQHYRATTQVVKRVAEFGGQGLALTGHHELLIPLIAWGLLAGAEAQASGEEPEVVPLALRQAEVVNAQGKVLTRRQLKGTLRALKQEGQRVVFTNGCFDLLHVGHLRYLEQARHLGDCLVVGINSDESVRRIKSDKRPFIPQAERAETLGALQCVDFVTIFDEDTPEELIRVLQPHIHVKGGDYRVQDLPEAETVRAYGGQVITVPLTPGHSTSWLAQSIVERLVPERKKQ